MNTAIALQRLNGNTALLATLAGFFLEDAPQLLEDLHEGLRKNSPRQITQSAHRLRGLASSFEASRVMELTSEIENLSGSDAAAHLEELVLQLDEEFARLMESLQKLSE
jgi:two-component system, sensor histidine kinase and response regulator